MCTPSSAISRVTALLALLVVLVSGEVMAEKELNCYDGPFESVLLDGCVDDCRSFEALEEAEQHCNALGSSCGGITKSAYGDDEAIQLGVGLYEVRAGPGIEAANGDTTWIKQADCDPASGQAPEEKTAVNDLENLVKKGVLTPSQDSSGQYCFSYSAPVQGQYLEGCVDECKSFETLDEAQSHCNSLDDCGGVTHSLYGEGQSWHEGNGPYEVRAGPTLKPSNDGDLSWVRIEHACDDTADYAADDFSSSSLEESVRTVDRSLMMSVVYVVGILAGVSLIVYVAYIQGHQRTVDFVDDAREKVRVMLSKHRLTKRGPPLSASSAYQSL